MDVFAAIISYNASLVFWSCVPGAILLGAMGKFPGKFSGEYRSYNPWLISGAYAVCFVAAIAYLGSFVVDDATLEYVIRDDVDGPIAATCYRHRNISRVEESMTLLARESAEPFRAYTVPASCKKARRTLEARYRVEP